MKNLLIGSRALAFWSPELKLKDSTDYDVISDEPIEGTEWHDPKCLDNYIMERYASDIFTYINGHKVYVVNMKGLAIIKRSHLWRNLNFQKHITQFHKYGLYEQYCNFSSSEITDYLIREVLTEEKFPLPNPPLNKTKDEFFDDGIYRRYDHDYLHKLVACYKKPLYRKLQTSEDEVKCHGDKWEFLTHVMKLECVAEEVYVTALERFICVDNPIAHKLAYIKSLDKVCTTMCSGWFRDFAIDNYPSIIALFNNKKINSVLKELGEIK